MNYLPTKLFSIVSLLMLLAAPVGALPVDGLYTAEIAVESQGEAERIRAYREGLERTLVKVTGQPRYLEQSPIQSALGRASEFVEEVSYRTAMTTVPVPGENDTLSPTASVQQAYLHVQFAQEQVDDLLMRADIPVWDRNRPSVLVWVSVQRQDGSRYLLGPESDHPALELIESFSEERAVPYMIPLMDLVDRRALNADRVWSLDQVAIREASERYAADSILAGRLMETAGGEVVGMWQFQFRDQVQTFDHVADGIRDFVNEPLERVTAQLAEHFALSRDVLERETEVSLRVEGVRDVDSYASLMGYLDSLAVVNDLQVSRLQSDQVELRLRVAGGAQQLSEFISLGRDLEPRNFSLGDVRTDELHYRWTR